MKVLSIGNSFSTDAQRWLHGIAEADGTELFCQNLYIGGCSLELHERNRAGNLAAYDLEENGIRTERKISIRDALQSHAWDVVTLQQASRFAGFAETFEPYLTSLIEEIRTYAPKAEILLHATWSFESGASIPSYEAYHFSQKEMTETIGRANRRYEKEKGLRLIPVGDAVAYVRENIPAFQYEKGGLSLNRDGRHLSYLYGRYLAGLVWYHTLTGKPIRNNAFVPHREAEETDPVLLDAIRQGVDEFFASDSRY